MDSQKQQALERLKQANNVLVTVSSNPTVDQLAAAVGFTLFLTKLDKHATAVFSGEVPSTIDFLKPDKTLERTTDSLRDFIISLDKSKADKLRYKVEDDHVKVFITPYRTSITEKDLEFSQGDFNVDAVVALGVQDQKDLDQAITAHGRILHDATVISVTTGAASSIGTINWTNAQASSLCEMMADLSESLHAGNLDNQMATAFLTGIVAETARFSNEKTSSTTMSVSAKLMTAGANQQLVASELQKNDSSPVFADDAPKSSSDGTLEIGHVDATDVAEIPNEEPASDQIHIDEHGEFGEPPKEEPKPADQDSRRLAMTEPPQLGGVLTASGQPEDLEIPIDSLAGHQDGPLLSHDSPVAPSVTPFVLPEEEAQNQPPAELPELPSSEEPTLPEPESATPAVSEAPMLPEAPVAPELPEEVPVSDQADDGTLADLERSVNSPHLAVDESAADVSADGTVDLDEARNAVMNAITESGNEPLPPIQALNAQPVDLDVLQVPPAHGEPDLSLPPGLIPDDTMPVDTTASFVENPTAPPPVPPPMMPPMPDLSLPPGLIPEDIPPAEPPQQDQNNPFGLPPA